MSAPLTVALVWIWLFGLISAVLADHKGLSGFRWFWAGAILGPVGVIIAACRSGLPTCPACGTRMRARGAYICPACNRDIRNPALAGRGHA